MPRRDPEPSDEAQEQLADAQAQIDSLQTAAADAEARAATAGDELAAVRAELVEASAVRDSAGAELASVQADLTSVRAELHSAQAELADLSAQLAEARAVLQDAALKYRDARLAAAPHIPPDLVPAADDLAEIDRQFEAAQRVVGQLRDKLQDETRSARVPVGSPPRRPPDLSALSPTEKIKLGLEQRGER